MIDDWSDRLAANGESYVRGCLHPVDSGGLRPARQRPEVGRAPVSVANTVGLVLAVLVALYLVAALLSPEKF